MEPKETRCPYLTAGNHQFSLGCRRSFGQQVAIDLSAKQNGVQANADKHISVWKTAINTRIEDMREVQNEPYSESRYNLFKATFFRDSWVRLLNTLDDLKDILQVADLDNSSTASRVAT